MRAELDQKLCKRFPVLYQDRRSPMSQTCMCWGFPGDGWFEIIWQLSLAIEEELGYSSLQEHWFLFKKSFAQRWSTLIYKLSPVVHRSKYKYEMQGSGTTKNPYKHVYSSPDPTPWDERIAQFLFGKTEGRFGGSRLALKHLIFYPDTGFAVGQVKEKFGTLRFYCPGNDAINRYVRLAERLSAITCEECGAGGKLGQRDGWYSTRCGECAPEGWQAIGKEKE